MILLNIYTMNHLDVRFFGIFHPYLNLDTDEKVYFIYGKYFVPEAEVTITVVVEEIYVLNPPIVLFQKYLTIKLMNFLALQVCIYNPDTWIKTNFNSSGFKYY